MTISAMSFSPLKTIEDMHDVSAQLPSGNDAFSTLVPTWTLPSALRRAAPTENFEYGL